jgi:hypothetical protein
MGNSGYADTYATRVESWLRADPAITTAELLRRARTLGYIGGKSAYYEMVHRARDAALPAVGEGHRREGPADRGERRPGLPGDPVAGTW